MKWLIFDILHSFSKIRGFSAEICKNMATHVTLTKCQVLFTRVLTYRTLLKCQIKRLPQTRTFCDSSQKDDDGACSTKPVHKVAPPWRVLFFGSDQFAVSSLHALNSNRTGPDQEKLVDSLEVVTVPRLTPVRKYATDEGLVIQDWPNPVHHGKYDVGVVVSFGKLIPSEIIRMFPYGILNVHPSLLPRWRGASPIAHTILNGDEIAGVSITEIQPKHFDIGAVLLRDVCPVPPRATTNELSEILAEMGARLLLKAMADLPKSENVETEQDSSEVTYAPKITSAMACIDWSKQTCDEIDKQYRAVSQLVSLRCQYLDHVVKLEDMIPPQESEVLDPSQHFDLTSMPAGTPYYHKKQKVLCIKCKDGWVGFRTIVLKKRMTADEFYNGYLSKSYNKEKLFGRLKKSCS